MTDLGQRGPNTHMEGLFRKGKGPYQNDLHLFSKALEYSTNFKPTSVGLPLSRI